MTIIAGISKVARHFQITVPKYVRESIGLNEGDLVNFEVRDGKVIFVPVVLRNKEQAYFWTESWQSEVRKSKE
ncbi:AbrB/MazE/SpoVT family DNA-binding domain-containing protein, partial [bacterium]|nr:AbrB/MazE/SpoVT family DNA-binding domain-containing protein [bacterium]